MVRGVSVGCEAGRGTGVGQVIAAIALAGVLAGLIGYPPEPAGWAMTLVAFATVATSVRRRPSRRAGQIV